MQYRAFFGVMRSPSNRCPRWLSQRAQRTSVRSIPCDRSSMYRMVPGRQLSNDGQPHWPNCLPDVRAHTGTIRPAGPVRVATKSSLSSAQLSK